MNTSDFKQLRLELGIIFALVGIQMGSVLTELSKGKIEFTNIFMVLSVLFLLDYKRLFTLKLCLCKENLIILVFQFYILLIAIVSKQSIFEQASGIKYILFTILIILCISTIDQLYKPNQFVHIMWCLLGFFNLLLTGIFTNSFTQFRIVSFTFLPYGADRLTLSTLSFVFLIATLVNKNTKKIWIVIKIIFILSAIYNILCCSRRAILVYFVIILFLHYFYFNNCYKYIKNKKKIIGSFIFFLIILIVFFLYNEEILVLINKYFGNYLDAIKNAVKTIFNKGGNDIAGLIRYNLRVESLNMLNDQTSMLQFIFGRGYMYKYLDFPFLQAIIDMGVIFGSIYIYIHTFLPLKYWINRGENRALQFMKYYSIMFFFDNLFGGIPYGYGKYVPLIFLFCFGQKTRIFKLQNFR